MVAENQSTVFVVDDDSSVRKSLIGLIESVRLQAKAFASAQEFLDSYSPSEAGCLILDVRMPGMSGLELQERLGELGIDIPIIMLTGHGDVAMAVRAMHRGAIDFIEKPFNDQLLLDRVQTALTQDLEHRAKRSRAAQTEILMGKLTPREKQVLDLIVAGRPNKTIASELGISYKTVEAHRAHIMHKLNAENIAGLIRLSLSA